MALELDIGSSVACLAARNNRPREEERPPVCVRHHLHLKYRVSHHLTVTSFEPVTT